MNSKVITAIDDEVSELQAAIANEPDPRQVKINELMAIRQTYLTKITGVLDVTFGNMKVESTGQAGPPVEMRQQIETPETDPHARKSPETRAIILTARQILSRSDRPLTNTDLVDALSRRGITVKGKNPANSLSAILFNAGEFQSGGRMGWTLKGQTPAQMLQDASLRRQKAAE